MVISFLITKLQEPQFGKKDNLGTAPEENIIILLVCWIARPELKKLGLESSTDFFFFFNCILSKKIEFTDSI